MELHPWQIRAEIYDGFLREGHPPSVDDLAQTLKSDVPTVKNLLRQLHNQHQIVLGNDSELIAAHPFSNVPMPFDVRFGDVRTWGFCIWDALGIAAMSGQDTTVDTACAFCLHHIHLEVIRGHLVIEREYVSQFLVPAQRMWDDVKFTCSTQLAFCDETHAKRWRERYHREPGSILSMPKTWQLAKIWYSNDRRAEAWRRPTTEETNAIFRQLELPEPFWHLAEAT